MVRTTNRQQRLPRTQARARNASRTRAKPACLLPRNYDRCTELARVLPLWPHELEDDSHAGRLRIIGKLRRALRAERRRGIAGHWTYDLARHAEILRIYRIELAASGLRRTKNGDFDGAPSQPKALLSLMLFDEEDGHCMANRNRSGNNVRAAPLSSRPAYPAKVGQQNKAPHPAEAPCFFCFFLAGALRAQARCCTHRLA